MQLEPYHRKVALAALGIGQRQISRELGVAYSLVSHVVAGRRWMGRDARRVMEYIAETLGLPVDRAFPGSDRRRGWRRATART